MKKLLLICFLTIAVGNSFAQTLPQLDQIKLKKNKDYKSAEPQVLQTANYVLSIPIDQNKTSRAAAGEFLLKWMDGTQDYTFMLDDVSTKSFLQNTDLTIVYFAAICKYALLNKSHDIKAVALNGVKGLLDYINNPANNVVKTDEIRELSEANDKGKLANFLGL